MNENIQVDPSDIHAKVEAKLYDAVNKMLPWFLTDMPEYYYKTHSEDEQTKHIMALVSGMVRDEKQYMVLHDPRGSMVTHITPGGDMHSLAGVLEKYKDKDIQISRIYSSRDDTIRLDTFKFNEDAQHGLDEQLQQLVQRLSKESEDAVGSDNVVAFGDFLASTSQDYIEKYDQDRAIRHFKAYQSLKNCDQVRVLLEKEVHVGFDRISITLENPPAKGLLLRIVNIFAREDIPVDRAYSDVFKRQDGTTIASMSFYLDRSRIDLDESTAQWQRLKRQFELAKWFAFNGLEPLAAEDGWEIGQVMLMQAACEFTHQFLVTEDMHAYTTRRITHAVLKYRDITNLLMDYFDIRFNPTLTGDREREQQECSDKVHEALRGIGNTVHKRIFSCIYNFFHHTLRTNYFMPDRTGLSFRIDPAMLAPMPEEKRPFGIYCFHGPYSFAFQVRYRDMARGGVRLVKTRTQEDFELESNRLFDEVTKLASAQQFKNKDIPEGGSKAVILLGPDGDIDLAIKSMVDSFLDLIVVPEGADGYVHPLIVDYLKREEVIFLGPDENITPHHINWISERARVRGYKWPNAFMSSKPGAGIAHKFYGVTSEGVVVFVDELLHTLGIDPRKQVFTVKITGGPDGDVASNVMKILIREYGENARIVAMSDGYGAVYDPDGMSHDELMRLINAELDASHFDKTKLQGDDAFAITTEEPDGVRIRNELHNTVVADVFIPSGGRPDTINMSNWKRFLQSDGTPSAKGIVEGANIFISADARAEIERKGTLVVPGPSANKTGVICSSYEILAGLILSEQEFLDIKDAYVAQLLDILRLRARSEARVLMREFKLAGGTRTITELSYELSESINALADKVTDVLEKNVHAVADDPRLTSVLLDYCPEILVERYHDRVVHDLPRRHQLALIASYVSAKMLYQEGMGWADELVAVRDVRDVVFGYLDEEKDVATLVQEVEDAGLKHADIIARILNNSGRKHLTLARLNLG